MKYTKKKLDFKMLQQKGISVVWNSAPCENWLKRTRILLPQESILSIECVEKPDLQKKLLTIFLSLRVSTGFS